MLTDVIQAEFGMSHHKSVYAQPVNSGMVMLALFVQTEKHGTLTQNPANAQFHQLGMVLLASLVLEEDSTIT